MKNSRRTHTSVCLADTRGLVARATSRGVTLDTASAEALASLGALPAMRKLDGVCRLVRTGRDQHLELSFREASERIELCGGNVDEAIRRILNAVAANEGISATVQYAADRGITLAPRSIGHLFKKRGYSGTRDYIDKLGLIMDAASVLSVDCTQARATQRLALAEGDAERVIADFTAERRRRLDRQAIACRVPVPPRALGERTNAFAGCGCPRCCDRLATHMQRYIGKLIAAPFFRDLDREEARAEANLELVRSIEAWPGGNFTGWFAARFTNRVREIYRSRSAEERAMLSLDAEDVLSDDHGGRIVPLGERIPDRSVDVLTIVLLRERIAEKLLALRRTCADRSEEYTNGSSAEPGPAVPSKASRLTAPGASATSSADPVEEPTPEGDRRDRDFSRSRWFHIRARRGASGARAHTGGRRRYVPRREEVPPDPAPTPCLPLPRQRFSDDQSPRIT